MQRIIRDIIDELDMMHQIIRQQQDVVTKFARLAKEILTVHSDESAKRPADKQPQQRGGSTPDDTRLSDFGKLADDFLGEIAARLAELEGLKRSASSTQDIVRCLGLSISSY